MQQILTGYAPRIVGAACSAAQIAVTLAGFGGVVVVFRRESVHEWSPIDEFSALRHSAAAGIAGTSLRPLRRINMEDGSSFPRGTLLGVFSRASGNTKGPTTVGEG